MNTIISSQKLLTLIPIDHFALRTPIILLNIRITLDYHAAFILYGGWSYYKETHVSLNLLSTALYN